MNGQLIESPPNEPNQLASPEIQLLPRVLNFEYEKYGLKLGLTSGSRGGEGACFCTQSRHYAQGGFAEKYGIASARGCFCAESRNYATFVPRTVAFQENVASHLQSIVSAHRLGSTPLSCSTKWLRMGVWNRTCKALFLHTVIPLRYICAPHGGFTGEYEIAPARACF